MQCNCTCPLGALAPAPAPMPLGFAPIIPQGAPSLGAASGPTAPLQPGTMLLLLPPSYAASTALPGELVSSAPLQALTARFMSILPDYSLRALDARPLLPQLPSSLQYTSVQGNILAIMTAAPARRNALNYTTTVIGYPSTYNTTAIISSITTAPGSFTPPTNLPNYTFTGLAAGAAVPSVPSGFRHGLLPNHLLNCVWEHFDWTRREVEMMNNCPLTRS
ncbi:hypothetical protein COCOBI_02-3260 [Coccomyxa sp. Obi]|nr:hypothetical protein COCOBI_02-3260 [Coccomyxa sp. Obi]